MKYKVVIMRNKVRLGDRKSQFFFNETYCNYENTDQK